MTAASRRFGQWNVPYIIVAVREYLVASDAFRELTAGSRRAKRIDNSTLSRSTTAPRARAMLNFSRVSSSTRRAFTTDFYRNLRSLLAVHSTRVSREVAAIDGHLSAINAGGHGEDRRRDPLARKIFIVEFEKCFTDRYRDWHAALVLLFSRGAYAGTLFTRESPRTQPSNAEPFRASLC